MEEFFARLKAHKLVQWLLGYAAVAVALIPVLDIVAAQFGWPEGLRRGITLAVIMGFFVVLVLAWYHGERGAEKMPRSEKLILVALIAISCVLLWRVAPRGHESAATVSTANTTDAKTIAAELAEVPQKSIAVLPLANDSGDKDQQYFSDGLSEDFINALSQLDGLKVIGRNSAFQFRNTKDDAQTIGAKLGVAHLLEGSVRRQGDTVRISAELINTSDASTLWSQHYDRPYKDLFALQDDVTDAVASALQAKLLDSGGTVVQSDRPPSGNLAAYIAYLQGNFHAAHYTDADARQAIAQYQAAIQLDPRYARAFAALSIAWTNLAAGDLGGPEAQQAYANARAAASTALALQPQFAASHTARGWLLLNADFDWAGAQAEYQRAAQLTPGGGDLWHRAYLSATLGDPAQALRLNQKALATDPLSAGKYNWQSHYLSSLSRLDEAAAASHTAIRMQPTGQAFHEQLATVEIQRGDAQAALAAAQAEAPGVWRDAALALARQIGPDRSAANAALTLLIDTWAESSSYQIAEVYALRRDPDPMFQWLDRAWASRDTGISFLLYDPFILRYQHDPRFAAFCRKVGLPTTTTAKAMP